MITYGYPREHLAQDLAIAGWLGATVVEVLPYWRALPDPAPVRKACDEAGLGIHSAHACWGGQSIAAPRVDLAEPEPAARRASLDDVKRCLDWLAAVGGRYLVVHPGGISERTHQSARTEALLQSLEGLADHVGRSELKVCVENMPPGVHPGERMADLCALIERLARPQVGLALDSGHAHLSGSVGSETRAAGPWLCTTHVHDNLGSSDAHLPPGSGNIDWSAWLESLDAVAYRGPILLECIRFLRENPASCDDRLHEQLRALTGEGFKDAKPD
jgi:sugar phosphate isomerase/epimerase